MNNEHTQTAVELVCDYLNDEWAAKVKEAFPGEKVGGKAWTMHPLRLFSYLYRSI